MSSRKCHEKHSVCRANVTCTCEWQWKGKSRERTGRRSDCPICTNRAGEGYEELSERTCPLGNHRFPRLGSAPYHELDGSKFLFRDQQDIYILRKTLAAGLLRTSKLVRIEAMPYFFGKNHFRFPGVGGWEALLRFFITIGPDARRFIRSLDVACPYGEFSWPEEPNGRAVYRIDQKLGARSKNDPKLHMAKIAPGQDCASIVEGVCRILLEDNVIQHLNLVVVEGCYEGLSQPSIDRIGRLRLPTLCQVTLVLEPNAFITDKNTYARIDSLEWDLVRRPGSYLRHSADTVWQYPSASKRCYIKYASPEGLPTLFGATDEFPQPCRGNPVDHKSEPRATVETRLQTHHLRKYGY
ncbi:MAG: hypothetical protein LQ346_002085 [Caloplaca aetnensis]|nr:MAG: hypothetical protein LQ346_002085 [Caloplaca aetnensis]